MPRSGSPSRRRRVVAAFAAFGPALATGSAGDSASSANTVLIKGSKKSPLKFVYPKTIVNGRRADHRKQVDPESDRPAHVLAGRGIAEPRNQAGPEEVLHPGPHLHGDRRLARRRRRRPGDQEPRQGRQARLGHRGLAEQERRLLVHRREARQLVHPEGHGRAGNGPTTIHFMCAIHPWMHGSIEVLPGG